MVRRFLPLIAFASVAVSACDGDATSTTGADAAGSVNESGTDALAPEEGLTDVGLCVAEKSVTLATAPTSACSFDLTEAHTNEQVNLAIVTGDTRSGVCSVSFSTKCGPRGGWYWAGEKLALCDATCAAFGGGTGQLVAELGCKTYHCSLK